MDKDLELYQLHQQADLQKLEMLNLMQNQLIIEQQQELLEQIQDSNGDGYSFSAKEEEQLMQSFENQNNNDDNPFGDY